MGSVMLEKFGLPLTFLPDAERWFMVFGGIVCSAYSFMFGDVGVLLWWLMIFVLFDMATGLYGAWRTGTIESKRISQGIVKKVVYFLVVALAHGIDQVFLPIIHVEIVESVVLGAYVAGEFVSIIENLERCGLGDAVPPTVRRALKALNGSIEHKLEKIEGKE